MTRILVIGGTSTISAHAVDALFAAGHAVTTFNRGRRDEAPAPSGVRVILGDRDDRATLEAALAEARPDVVIDFVCFQPEQTEAVADAVIGRRTSRLRQHRRRLRLSAEDAARPGIRSPQSAGRDLRRKKQQCEALLGAKLAGKLPLTIVRPTFSVGRRFVIAFFDGSSAMMMNRIRHGLPVVVPGDGTSLIHPSASRDTGAMIARVAGDGVAYGKTYTCDTDGAFMPVDAYVGMIASVLGHEPKRVHIPKALIAEARLPAITEGIYNNVTRFDLAFGFEAFKADFPDFRWEADLVAPIRAYVARLEGEGAFRRPPEPAIDDALIAAWEKARAGFAGL